MEKPLKCVRSPKALFDFEPLSEARTPPADFFSILLESHSLEDKLIAPKAVCSSQIEEAKTQAHGKRELLSQALRLQKDSRRANLSNRDRQTFLAFSYSS